MSCRLFHRPVVSGEMHRRFQQLSPIGKKGALTTRRPRATSNLMKPRLFGKKGKDADATLAATLGSTSGAGDAVGEIVEIVGATMGADAIAAPVLAAKVLARGATSAGARMGRGKDSGRHAGAGHAAARAGATAVGLAGARPRRGAGAADDRGFVRSFQACKEGVFKTCPLTEAACALVAEEGRGNCVYYPYRTEAFGREQLGKWRCPLASRILFAVEFSKIAGEIGRRGPPRSHGAILTAARALRRSVLEAIEEEPEDEAASEEEFEVIVAL